MTHPIRCALHFLQRRPLARCTAVAFALCSPAALAANVLVSNCNDSGPNSLRAAAAVAGDNDVIDMTTLSCSVITLTTGAIALPQTNVTLDGPGMNSLTVTGKSNNVREHDRILMHSGTGSLSVYHMSVAEGYVTLASGAAAGGCIQSAGSVILRQTAVYGCSTSTKASGRAKGGGIYAHGNITLKYSLLTGNTAFGYTIPGGGGGVIGGYGGGAYAYGNFISKYSTISANQTVLHGFGGGVFAYHGVTLNGSTVSGNTAAENGGGIYNRRFSATSALTTSIRNSTISGNHAGYYNGGLVTTSGTVHLYNSTIVFNTAQKGRNSSSYPFTYRAPGVELVDDIAAVAVSMQSSLIANNTYGATEYDLSVPKRSSTSVTFSGNNNLVRVTFAAVPPGTIKISCPLLGPLRDNGGATLTHALLSHSPGIDQGNNLVNLTYDQRGSPNTRVDNGTADIGAYEVQHGDIVFNNGFEGCPLLF